MRAGRNCLPANGLPQQLLRVELRLPSRKGPHPIAAGNKRRSESVHELCHGNVRFQRFAPKRNYSCPSSVGTGGVGHGLATNCEQQH